MKIKLEARGHKKMKTIIILTLFCINLQLNHAKNNISLEDSLIVEIVQGKLKGKLGQTLSGRNFTEFLAVPYANPPKRFYPPERVDAWEDVKDATNYGPKCAQLQDDSVVISEDCLILNIHTPFLPTENSTKLLPVAVFFHGGSFQFGGFWAEYGPEYLMEVDFIYVAINYRLGAFGFLSTGNDDGNQNVEDFVSGNNGLKDQVMALKFLQENVKFFGGDKDRVILIGESAGASAVSYHLLSPMSKGLFSGGISISGSALCPWARSLRPWETFSRLTNLVNCTEESTAERLKCLRNVDFREILRHQALFKWDLDPIASFGPVVENSTNGFLLDSPYKLLNEGPIANPVPWIVGVVKQEGLLLHAARILKNETLTQQLNNDWLRVAPLTLLYDELVPSEESNKVSEIIREFYFGQESISNLTVDGLANLYSDRSFIFPVEEASRLYAKHGAPTYLYLFEYAGEYTNVDPTPGNPQHIVSHGDDIQYLLHARFRPDYPQNSTSAEMTERYIKLWHSFATNLKPTETWGSALEWPQLNAAESLNGNLTWYKIDSETSLVQEPFQRRMEFWRSLPYFSQ